MSVISQLSSDLELLGASESPALIDKVGRLAEITVQWSHRLNLTGFAEPLALARHLIVEPLLWSRLIQAPRTVADLGSGAGFPGFPLALRFPEASLSLIEARRRRHHFQRHIVRKLALSNAKPILGRIEALRPQPKDLVVAQALANPEQAVRLMIPWAAIGGQLAIPTKAPDAIEIAPECSKCLRPETPLSYPRLDGSLGAVWLARRIA